MRIEQLEYVLAVTKFGSLRQASEYLHISQPALSEGISKLERELGVTLIDRRRTGARISRQGRELLQPMTDILDGVHRLRSAAGDQTTSSRLVRVGTVNTATASLLIPALRTLQEQHPNTVVEVLDMLQAEIQLGLEEGSLDLGLVNLLDGDELPISLRPTPLLSGRPVVVLPAGHSYASKSSITVDQLRSERFVLMRAGYLMHRFAQRLFGDRPPPRCRSTDGAEMGKIMVAEGLGLTLLPDFSVDGDPLTRSGLITARPIAGDQTAIRLVMLESRASRSPEQVRALASTLSRQALSAGDGSPAQSTA